MKITPLDIQHKVLDRQWRGYHKTQVDQFLEEIAESVEELTKENMMLKETSGIYIDQYLNFDPIVCGSTEARCAT